MSNTGNTFFGAALFAAGYGLGKLSHQEPQWIALMAVAAVAAFALAIYANTQEPPPMTEADPMDGLPQQPIVVVADKVIRFRANRIVEMLYTKAVAGQKFGLNDIAVLAHQGVFTKAEQMQFAQLLGYSVSGFGELSYAHPLVVAEADARAEAVYGASRGETT